MSPTRRMVLMSPNDVEETSVWIDYSNISSKINPITVGYIIKNKM